MEINNLHDIGRHRARIGTPRTLPVAGTIEWHRAQVWSSGMAAKKRKKAHKKGTSAYFVFFSAPITRQFYFLKA
jgi:hypothetical protein